MTDESRLALRAREPCARANRRGNRFLDRWLAVADIA
jgi:hypothetical protein